MSSPKPYHSHPRATLLCPFTLAPTTVIISVAAGGMLTYVYVCDGGGKPDRDDRIHVQCGAEKGYCREAWTREPDGEVRCAGRCVKLSLVLQERNMGAGGRRDPMSRDW
jgi:hypothetical protein